MYGFTWLASRQLEYESSIETNSDKTSSNANTNVGLLSKYIIAKLRLPNVNAVVLKLHCVYTLRLSTSIR